MLDAEGQGALTNDRFDPGGMTKFGISQHAFPALDIAALTREDAIAIYRREYWGRAGCDRMPWPWALAVFDAAVNQGTLGSVRRAQKVLGVTLDGVVGPRTLAAMAASGWEDRLADFFAWRCVAYAASPSATHYAHGWFRRCFVVYAAALR